MIISHSVFDLAPPVLAAVFFCAGGLFVLIVWGYFHRRKK